MGWSVVGGAHVEGSMWGEDDPSTDLHQRGRRIPHPSPRTDPKGLKIEDVVLYPATMTDRTDHKIMSNAPRWNSLGLLDPGPYLESKLASHPHPGSQVPLLSYP